MKQAIEKPGDARVHVFVSSFYRFTNNLVPATEQLAIARSLSPNKQQIIFEQGLVELNKSDFDAALAFSKKRTILHQSTGLPVFSMQPQHFSLDRQSCLTSL